MSISLNSNLNPLEEADKAKAAPKQWFVQNPLLPRQADPINKKGRLFDIFSLVAGLGIVALFYVFMTHDTLKRYRIAFLVFVFLLCIIMQVFKTKKTYRRNSKEIEVTRDGDGKPPLG